VAQLQELHALLLVAVVVVRRDGHLLLPQLALAHEVYPRFSLGAGAAAGGGVPALGPEQAEIGHVDGVRVVVGGLVHLDVVGDGGDHADEALERLQLHRRHRARRRRERRLAQQLADLLEHVAQQRVAVVVDVHLDHERRLPDEADEPLHRHLLQLRAVGAAAHAEQHEHEEGLKLELQEPGGGGGGD